MKKITVVVPVYNGADLLVESLDSLLFQSTPLHEVIVVDDGSVDGSGDIARGHPLQPRVIEQRNLGVAFARNRGVLASTGEFVALLDQDDLWGRFRHTRIQEYLSANPECNALVTNCTGFSKEADTQSLRAAGEALHRENAILPDSANAFDVFETEESANPSVLVRKVSVRELLAGPVSVTGSYFVQRDLFIRSGGCVPFARSFDEYFALINIALADEVHLVDEPSLLYRIHPRSTSMTMSWYLPLVVNMMAVRHAGRVASPGGGRDCTEVPPIFGDNQFLQHNIRELARSSNRGLFDAMAASQLLATSRTELWLLFRTLLRARLGSIRHFNSS
jgi:glycosyltransferase involved in cell wall biosynthesis